VIFRFVLQTLACYRVVRLITRDSWPPVAALRRRAGEGYWGEFFSCSWCCGSIITLIVFAVLPLSTNLTLAVLAAVAAAAVVGLIGEWDGK